MHQSMDRNCIEYCVPYSLVNSILALADFRIGWRNRENMRGWSDGLILHGYGRGYCI